jgi:hypothetical protein
MLLARRSVQLRSALSLLKASNHRTRAGQCFRVAAAKPQRLLVKAMSSEVEAARAAARFVMHRTFPLHRGLQADVLF